MEIPEKPTFESLANEARRYGRKRASDMTNVMDPTIPYFKR
jgi:hypothetical protein